MTRTRRLAAALVAALALAACSAQPPGKVQGSTVAAPSAASSTDASTSPASGGASSSAAAAPTSGAGSRTGPTPTQPSVIATPAATSTAQEPPTSGSSGGLVTAASSADSAATSPTATAGPPGTFTLALAGDINFSERTAALLAADPATALQQAADQLRGADVTMVNLETAITTRGTPAPKQFHFRAPATALEALQAGGVDVATMANNHAVDYGNQGLADTLAAIHDSPIPVIGIGANADAAYAPYRATVNGVKVAILAASQVRDWTLASHTATDTSPGIANAYSARLVDAVRAARQLADVVVVYLHWGVEYDTCPSRDQRSLADALAKAGAAAVVGTHAHVLQGAGWRTDGAYVAYGLGNYYWWRSFGNEQDDNGVLTLTFGEQGPGGIRVTAADLLPTHLDGRGVPMVATGSQRDRILAQWERDRKCANLSADPPG